MVAIQKSAENIQFYVTLWIERLEQTSFHFTQTLVDFSYKIKRDEFVMNANWNEKLQKCNEVSETKSWNLKKRGEWSLKQLGLIFIL